MVAVILFIYIGVAVLMAGLMTMVWWQAGSWQALTEVANAKQKEMFPETYKEKSVERVQWGAVNNVVFWPIVWVYAFFKLRRA